MMAIVNSRYDCYRNDGSCSLCGGGLRYPFLCWRWFEKKGGDIKICNRCCRKIKQGFIADLIQITAAMDISELYPNAGTRLVRTTEERLDHEGKRREEKEEAVMLAFRPKAETQDH
jgi:hypothetical protein